jgi:transposase-like protein
MDSFSFLQDLAKSTHQTTSYVPLDNEGKCPYCTNPSYETKSKINNGLDKVECLNCHKKFFISH